MLDDLKSAERKDMTIKQLKKQLEKYPDNMNVYVWDHFTGFDIDADVVSKCEKPLEVEVSPVKFVPGSKKSSEKFLVLLCKRDNDKIVERMKMFKKYEENGEVPPCITAEIESKIPLNKSIEF